MNKQTKVFKVAPGRIATSRKDDKTYREGEVIDLSHCNETEIANLIASGLIVEAREEKTHAPVRLKPDSAGEEAVNG